MTLPLFREISGGPFGFFNVDVVNQFGNCTAHGWVLVSKKVIPSSRSKSYEVQKQMVEEQKGFRMLHTLEAVAAVQMIFAFTNERLYSKSPLTYTRCVEKVDSRYPVVVGGFGSDGLIVGTGIDCVGFGVAALREF